MELDSILKENHPEEATRTLSVGLESKQKAGGGEGKKKRERDE